MNNAAVVEPKPEALRFSVKPLENGIYKADISIGFGGDGISFAQNRPKLVHAIMDYWKKSYLYVDVEITDFTFTEGDMFLQDALSVSWRVKNKE